MQNILNQNLVDVGWKSRPNTLSLNAQSGPKSADTYWESSRHSQMGKLDVYKPKYRPNTPIRNKNTTPPLVRTGWWSGGLVLLRLSLCLFFSPLLFNLFYLTLYVFALAHVLFLLFVAEPVCDKSCASKQYKIYPTIFRPSPDYLGRPGPSISTSCFSNSFMHRTKHPPTELKPLTTLYPSSHPFLETVDITECNISAKNGFRQD